MRQKNFKYKKVRSRHFPHAYIFKELILRFLIFQVHMRSGANSSGVFERVIRSGPSIIFLPICNSYEDQYLQLCRDVQVMHLFSLTNTKTKKLN